MSVFPHVDISDPRQATPAVIRDAILNILTVLIASAVIYGLSKVSWWAGVIPFWILAVITVISVLMYVFSAILCLSALVADFISGFSSGWEPFQLSVLTSIGTLFKLLEATVDILVIYSFWTYFYS